MQFEKPKAFIDLEEYRHLKDRVNGMDTDEYVVAAKKVIAALLNNRGDMSATGDALLSQGVVFSIAYGSTSMQYKSIGVHHDSISISLIEKNKQDG